MRKRPIAYLLRTHTPISRVSTIVMTLLGSLLMAAVALTACGDDAGQSPNPVPAASDAPGPTSSAAAQSADVFTQPVSAETVHMDSSLDNRSEDFVASTRSTPTQRPTDPLTGQKGIQAADLSPGAADSAAQASAKIAPCSNVAGTNSTCSPRDVSSFNPFTRHRGGPFISEHPTEAATVEEVLEYGLETGGLSPTHLAVRGTGEAGSVRCDWRGIARTLDQRTEAIRTWLRLEDSETVPEADLLEAIFVSTIEVLRPDFTETLKSNFMSIARGGLSEEYMFLSCYADYAISDYILGSGPAAPSTITVVYDRMDEARSYELYVREHEAGQFDPDPLQTQEEYDSFLDGLVWDAESELAERVESREAVVFLAPMGSHNAIAKEAWQAVAQWDLQTVDGTVNAVRYGVLADDPEHSQTLTNLESRIDTAATSDAFATSRIANVNGLNQHYRDIGAYDDITPDDGDTSTFTPAQPPSELACAGGDAVTDPNDNRSLVHDCEALINARDSLRGSGTLNWDLSRNIRTSWQGVTVSGPTGNKRVIHIDLTSQGLAGTISASLAELSALQHLGLRSNRLSGAIPPELGEMSRLTGLHLGGNDLTGAIPAELAQLPRLVSLDLHDNDLDGAIPPELGEMSTLESLALSDNDLSGEIPEELSELSGLVSLGLANNDLTGTIPDWLLDLRNLTGLTLAGNELTGCIPERLTDIRTHDLASMMLPLCMTVSADSEDPVAGQTVDLSVSLPRATSYQWQQNSGSGWTLINGATDSTYAASVTAAGAVSYRAQVGHRSGITSNSPEIELDWRYHCNAGHAFTNPGSKAGLVQDCETLIAIRDTLGADPQLNWDTSVPVTQWTGVRVASDTNRVEGLRLTASGLSGTIPSGLGSLSALERLDLDDNTLSGPIPSELGQLTNLLALYLNGNQLTGAIPTTLGSMSSLSILSLYNNQLNGAIPAALGDLSTLEELLLNSNQLSDSIPADLGDLDNLTTMRLENNSLSGQIPTSLGSLDSIVDIYLDGNDFTGCVPVGLWNMDTAHSDARRLGLPSC